jgi:hypothetical protein
MTPHRRRRLHSDILLSHLLLVPFVLVIHLHAVLTVVYIVAVVQLANVTAVVVVVVLTAPLLAVLDVVVVVDAVVAFGSIPNEFSASRYYIEWYSFQIEE